MIADDNRFVPSCIRMWRFFGLGNMFSLVFFPRLVCRISKYSWGTLYFDALQNWARKNYGKILDKYKHLNVVDVPKDYPIWVLWYQGEKQMPDVIRQCVNSIRRNSNGHQVILLTSENVFEYADIPEIVKKKVELGLITKTHFSDIVRASLLAKYGGLWIDAAIFVLKPIDIRGPFFSINRGVCRSELSSFGKWVGGCIAFGKNNPAISFVRDSYYSYWERHDRLIEFALSDVFIRYAYENLEQFKNLVDSLSLNSPNFSEARYLFDKPVDDNKLEKILHDNQFLSLTWRVNYHSDEYESFYDKMISLITE